MISRVDTVLIGKKCPTAYTTADALAVGDVALFDENKQIIKTAADAVKASNIYVGVAKAKIKVTMPNGTVADKANIEFSNKIQKISKPSMVLQEYVAPVEDSIKFDLASATIVTGHRYVIRVVYKDMIEAKNQFTHTYEVVAGSETVKDLIDAFAAKMNKHANRRFTVASTTNTLTITAMPKDDNEGVDSLSEYSVVSMEASLYKTIPHALISNYPEKVPGVTITRTQGNPGRGYWKQVRDIEKRMQGYKGFKFTDAYPPVVSKPMVVEGAEYDYMIIENDNMYLSDDMHHIENTPLMTELYVEKGTLADSVFTDCVEAFITGAAPAAGEGDGNG